MKRILNPAALAAALLVAAVPCAWAQSDLAQAQARFKREVAACNSGHLPAPKREACVRAAGTKLDAVRGGPPGHVTTRSADGRSTLVLPEGTPPPPATTRGRSSDGRSTIQVPANAATP